MSVDFTSSFLSHPFHSQESDGFTHLLRRLQLVGLDEMVRVRRRIGRFEANGVNLLRQTEQLGTLSGHRTSALESTQSPAKRDLCHKMNELTSASSIGLSSVLKTL